MPKITPRPNPLGTDATSVAVRGSVRSASARPRVWYCIVICGLLALWLQGAPAFAENWPRWRGPEGYGVSTETELPISWSRSENVDWTVEIPGEGTSSPIVWDDRVFVTSAQDYGAERLVHCLDATTGGRLWSRSIADDDPERASGLTGYAAATPVTNGSHVVAFFGNAGLVCYDYSGELQWHRDLGTFESELGLASSPVLFEGAVIQLCDHDGDRFGSFDSYLIAVDVASGKTRWKTERPGLFRSWSTPLIVDEPGTSPVIVVNAQDELRGYDARTGKQVWHVLGMTGWVTPSPVFGEGAIFATSGKDGPTLAVRPGGEGDITKTHVIWERRRGAPYVCSPLYHEGLLYVHDEAGRLTCLRARDGSVVYQQRLAGKFMASAVAVEGRIYLSNETGTTFVFQAGEEFHILAENSLNEEILASPAISGKRLFLRTETRLYCISR